MEILEHLFSLVCGQEPGHTWAPGGIPLPFCQRCTGLYAGTAAALVLLLVLRPRRTRAFFWAHGICILQMVPLGFHLVPQGPVLRTLSGAAFAFGVTAFLLPAPDEGIAGPRPAGRGAYGIAAVFAAALILLLAGRGGAAAGALLAGAGAAGIAALGGLAAAFLARSAARTAAFRRPRRA